MFLIQRDARDGTVQTATVALARPPRTPSNNGTKKQARPGVCRLSAPAGRQMGSETRERPQVKAFLREEFRAPSNVQLRSKRPVSFFFMCLNNSHEWLKGCEKPVYFKVRVETDICGDVSYVRGSVLASLFLTCAVNTKASPRKPRWRGEEFITCSPSPRPLGSKTRQDRKYLRKYCRGKGLVTYVFYNEKQDCRVLDFRPP